MKIRTGFVSNSSSSSFLIVGIEGNCNDYKDNQILLGLLVEKMGFDIKNDHCDFGIWQNDETQDIAIYGYDTPYMVGMEIKNDLLKNKTFSELNKKFRDIVFKNYGVVISENRVDILYGEAGSG